MIELGGLMCLRCSGEGKSHKGIKEGEMGIMSNCIFAPIRSKQS